MSTPIYGVIGATGVIGRQVVQSLLTHDVEPDDVRFYAGEKSAGEELDYGEEPLPVEPTGPEAFKGVTVAVLASPLAQARELASRLQQQGTWVIDVTGAHRLDQAVPLVAPGLNDGVLDRAFTGRIVSLAHPVTQGLLATLEPLRALWGLAVADATLLVGAATYGTAGVERLAKQTADLMNGKEPDVDTFAYRLGFNLIPAVGPLEHGLAELERHVLVEAARVWGSGSQPGAQAPALPALTGTSVLVPTYHGALGTLTVHLRRPVDVEAVRECLKTSSELKLLDDPEQNVFPMPMLSTDDPAIHVGRVRTQGERVQLVFALDPTTRLADSAVELALELAER